MYKAKPRRAFGGFLPQAGVTEDDELTRSALKALDMLQERAKAVEGMPLRYAFFCCLRPARTAKPADQPIAVSRSADSIGDQSISDMWNCPLNQSTNLTTFEPNNSERHVVAL